MKTELDRLAVIIPAYKPENALAQLSIDLLAKGFRQIIIVDDGSGPEYAGIFAELKKAGCKVLANANMGRGRAIKTAINDVLIADLGIAGIVIVDDGYLVDDIIKVGTELLNHQDTMILGKRKVNCEDRLERRSVNAITKAVFNFVSGQRVHDIRTGLRGIPSTALKDILSLPGERYEYELNMLLEASRLNLKLIETDVETAYTKSKKDSGFIALKDSWRIYRQIFMFAGSSLIAFFVDALMFTLLTFVFPGIVWAPVLGARLICTTVNFSINRNVIFSKGHGGNLKRHIIGYFILVAIIMAAGIGIITLLISLGVNIYLAYVISTLLLFSISFPVQKHIIFK